MDMRNNQTSDQIQPDPGFRRAVWLLPCAWALHEAEEWNILGWYHRYWVNVPEVTATDIRTGLAFIALVGFVWTLVGALFRNPKATASLVLPFFTAVASGNALQHIYFVFRFGTYAPGVVTAALVVIPCTLYVTLRAVRNGLISRWYAAIIYLPVIPLLALTIRAGNEVSPVIHIIARFSSDLAQLIFGGR